MTAAFGKDIKDLTMVELVLLARQGWAESGKALTEARRRDMCQFSNGSAGNNQATAQANLSQQMDSASQMMNAAAPKFSKGDVVYLRAVVTEVGDCGQIGVAVKQPGDKVVSQFIPAEQEIFRAKRQLKAATILE